MHQRTMTELLDILGADTRMPFMGQGIVEAFEAGSITQAEARWLQSFASRHYGRQQGLLRRERAATPEALHRMRARLNRQMDRVRSIRPDLSREDPPGAEE